MDNLNGQAPSLNELRQHNALLTLEASLRNLLTVCGDEHNLFDQLSSLQIGSFSDSTLTKTDHKDQGFFIKVYWRLLQRVIAFRKAIASDHTETIQEGWQSMRGAISDFLFYYDKMESVDKNFEWLLKSGLCDHELFDAYEEKTCVRFFIGLCREFIVSVIGLSVVLDSVD